MLLVTLSASGLFIFVEIKYQDDYPFPFFIYIYQFVTALFSGTAFSGAFWRAAHLESAKACE